MKAQYFGDENDYRKYALLRLLAKSGGFKIGICWMLTPADERSNGGKRSYVQHPAKWRAFDPDLFDLMATVKPKPGLVDLLRIEREGLIPGAKFFNEVIPDPRGERVAFHQACLSAFNGCDLVFFDPDNGLDVLSLPKGRKNSGKFVFRDEISDHYAVGRSILCYQHFAREHRPTFLSKTAGDLSLALPSASVWCFQTAHVAFFLGAQPGHARRVGAVAEEVAEKWPEWFVKAQANMMAKSQLNGEHDNLRPA
jgi:hypothetical protein